MVLSALAFGLLRPIEKLRSLWALLDYMGARMTMNRALEVLPSDPAWRFLQASEHGPDALSTWPLQRLLDYKSREVGVQQQPVEDSPGERLRVKPVPRKANEPPGPPGQAGVRVQIIMEESVWPLHALASALDQLGNGDTLTRAMKYSARYQISVSQWTSLRADLVFQSMSRNPPKESALFPPRMEEEAVPGEWRIGDFSREMTRQYLTMPQIETLARSGLPTVEEAEALLKQFEAGTLPPVGVGVSYATALVVVEFGLLFSCIYFWLFYREARRSPEFPSEGTLFGALSRTRMSRSLFVLAQAVPAISAVLLARRSAWMGGYQWIWGVAALVFIWAVLIRWLGELPPTTGAQASGQHHA
jgi:hypothetical protein